MQPWMQCSICFHSIRFVDAPAVQNNIQLLHWENCTQKPIEIINQYIRILPVIEPVVHFFVMRVPGCKNIYKTFYFLCIRNPIILLVSPLFPCEFLDGVFPFSSNDKTTLFWGGDASSVSMTSFFYRILHRCCTESVYSF